MFYCDTCGGVFEKPEIISERHFLDSPPFEKIPVCPICRSTDFSDEIISHCKCCGAKLETEESEYCSNECRQKFQASKKKVKINHITPLALIIKQMEIYNKEHSTDYSYGQYVALIEKKEKKENKANARKE